MSIVIGITDCSKYQNYHKWIAAESGVEVIQLSHQQGNASAVEKCNGIVLTGGEDVHPSYYGREDYLPYCEVNEERDAFEWKVLELVEKHKRPLLGICRGLQIANVFYGGTLIPHLPSFGKFDHAEGERGDRYHDIYVDCNSRLMTFLNVLTGEVNSAHHQAADRIAPGFVANALSPDGVVEGIEREAGKEGAFLQLVQWHPERMKDPGSAFSGQLKLVFLEQCRL